MVDVYKDQSDLDNSLTLANFLIEHKQFSSMDLILDIFDLSTAKLPVIMLFVQSFFEFKEKLNSYDNFITRCVRELNDRGLDSRSLLKGVI